jgi:hypothetical protein
MGTDYRGAFMVAWSQTRLEGSPAEPQSELAEGMSWSWHGRALPLGDTVAAPGSTASRDHDDVRARAARVARDLLRRPATCPAAFPAADAGLSRPLHDATDAGDPLLSGSFVVSDGTTFYPVVPVETDPGAPMVLVFPDGLPDPGRRHTIVACTERVKLRRAAAQPAVICFTPGTRLQTAHGNVDVADIRPGDRISTRDDGAQGVLWTGRRRMSGARLFALPAERPVRIRAGALGPGRPERDLTVSPEHRVLIGGPGPRALWGEPEVLVRAGDLVGRRGISVDHSLRETWYIHLMLERHEVVRADGADVETFHPGYMGLEALSPDQRQTLIRARPDLDRDPFAYGPPARRMLSRGEAAILAEGGTARAA